MDKRIKLFLIICTIGEVFFGILALASVVYSIIIIADQDLFWDNLLSFVYSLFHLAITVFATYLCFRSLKKGSVIFRTLAYKNDYQEKTVSPVAHVISLVGFALTMFVGTYSIIVFAKPNSGLFFSDAAIVMKIDLINAMFFLAFFCLLLFIFPIINEKVEKNKKDISLK